MTLDKLETDSPSSSSFLPLRSYPTISCRNCPVLSIMNSSRLSRINSQDFIWSVHRYFNSEEFRSYPHSLVNEYLLSWIQALFVPCFFHYLLRIIHIYHLQTSLFLAHLPLWSFFHLYGSFFEIDRFDEARFQLPYAPSAWELYKFPVFQHLITHQRNLSARCCTPHSSEFVWEELV